MDGMRIFSIPILYRRTSTYGTRRQRLFPPTHFLPYHRLCDTSCRHFTATINAVAFSSNRGGKVYSSVIAPSGTRAVLSALIPGVPGRRP